jgi:hypothetical protein
LAVHAQLPAIDSLIKRFRGNNTVGNSCFQLFISCTNAFTKGFLQYNFASSSNLNQQIIMKKIFLLVATSTLLFACDKEKNKEGVFKSQEVTIHGGKAWSQVRLNKDGVPQQLSLVLNDDVLNTVPIGGEGDGHDGHGNDLFIPLHNKAIESTPFKTIMLNWNKNGHEPAGIYTLPHFDFHFYTTPESEVMGYTDTVKMDHNLPAAAYVPPTYIAPGPGIPMMGKHYIDVTSPELNGQTFTQTFLYGSYDSKVVFMEPMITLAFLKNTTSFERAIPQPSKYQQSGYYPTKLRIVKHDGVTEIILDGFVQRQAS